MAGRRNVAAALRGLDVLAGASGAALVHPYLEPRFLAALARDGGALGRGTRVTAWPALFAGLLPERVLGRPTKASYDAVYFGAHAQRFADGWRGSEVFGELVDPDGLRAVWRERPLFRLKTGLLMQALWLEARAAG
jgi:asparagine synthase (glutamine-hydrolysing)